MSYENYRLLNYGWIGLAVLIFVVLLFITAPYGRHTKTSWGPLIDNRLAWVVMEVFVLVVLIYFIVTGENKQSVANKVIIGFFMVHYLNRSLIFPFRLKTSGKKMPLSIMLMGMTFNLVSGFLFGYYFGSLKIYDISWLKTGYFIAGTCIFVLGMGINWWSDTILIHLRKPGETGYKIPVGGFFKYVSAPNLLGEVMEWLGFAILTWSLPGLAFFIWTAANLIPRAIDHHKWYLNHFENYPAERKAVIPFLL